jgi:hypothetical protein
MVQAGAWQNVIRTVSDFVKYVGMKNIVDKDILLR